MKPKPIRNRGKPGKTDPNETDPKPKPKYEKPTRLFGFGFGFMFKPIREKPNRTDN